MNAYLLIFPAFIMLCVGSWLSYHPTHKERTWFPMALIGIGIAGNWLWAIGASWTPDPRKLYSLSACWDVATIFAYNVLPLVCFGVRLSPTAWVGFVLVVVGAVLVKNG